MNKYLLGIVIFSSLFFSQAAVAVLGCGPYKVIIIQPNRVSIDLKLKTSDGTQVWKTLGKYTEPSTRYFQAAAQQALATNTELNMRFDDDYQGRGGTCSANDSSYPPLVVQLTGFPNKD